MTGAALAFVACEAIGVGAAIWPSAWLRLFGDDPVMIATGSEYLRFVGPTYGFFGLGLALYFASQGAGKLMWPLLAGFARLVIAVGGGWLALTLTGSLTMVFVMLGIALATYGVIVAIAVKSGVWFRERPGFRALVVSPRPRSCYRLGPTDRARPVDLVARRQPASRTAGHDDVGSHDHKAQMPFHGREVAVIVEQGMTVFDAEGPDDEIGGLADRNAQFAQFAIVPADGNRRPAAARRRKSATRVRCAEREPRCGRPGELQQDEVADQERLPPCRSRRVRSPRRWAIQTEASTRITGGPEHGPDASHRGFLPNPTP